jgi:hypothetical protein
MTDRRSATSERHSFSIAHFVLGVAMVGFAVLARYGTGRGAVANWPWVVGFFMVALGISLVLGALRTDGEVRSDVVPEQPTIDAAGMLEPSNEFQSYASDNPADTPE